MEHQLYITLKLVIADDKTYIQLSIYLWCQFVPLLLVHTYFLSSTVPVNWQYTKEEKKRNERNHGSNQKRACYIYYGYSCTFTHQLLLWKMHAFLFPSSSMLTLFNLGKKWFAWFPQNVWKVFYLLVKLGSNFELKGGHSKIALKVTPKPKSNSDL